jgi:hypothetical protein
MRGRLTLVGALALAAAGTAAAELAVPRVQDGMLAVSPSGTSFVAYLQGRSLEIARRRGGANWRSVRAGHVERGAHLVAFAAGKRGPVALVRGPRARTLVLVRRVGTSWKTTPLRRVPPGHELGWPGLALERGLPTIAYTRWTRSSKKSVLELVRVDGRGRLQRTQITLSGFPRSYYPPSAVPVLVRGAVHVIESYGFDGAVGTIEWHPNGHGWSGQYIDGGIGDFPVGPMFGAVGRTGTVYAAWSEALLGTGEQPVTLAVHGRSIDANFLLDRAVTTGLDLTRSGPEVAANEWVAAAEVGLPGQSVSWAGIVVVRGEPVELDGWLAGLASAPRGARDLLLANSKGLSWFRVSRRPSVRMSIDAADDFDGSVLVSGRVRGVSSGSVAVYRERPGSPRERAGTAPLARDGSFTLLDRPLLRPFVYRAVYTDPVTGVPYSALLRDPIS